MKQKTKVNQRGNQLKSDYLKRLTKFKTAGKNNQGKREVTEQCLECKGDATRNVSRMIIFMLKQLKLRSNGQIPRKIYLILAQKGR